MTLDGWIARQWARSTDALLGCISTPVVKHRAHFHQTIVPKRGSVVASARIAAYDPDPDYFFHWYRDSAIVMDALRVLREHGTLDGRAHMEDFIAFSRDLAALDGRGLALPAAEPGFARFLRRDLDQAHGDAIPAETRINPDGTLDISDWPRPQHDGPALRALAVARWLPHLADMRDATALLRADLAFAAAHAERPCFDIWEEEMGLHYYTLRVSAAALAEGERIFPDMGYGRQADAILARLDGYWRGTHLGAHAEPGPKDCDISVLLAVLHAGGRGSHAVDDPRVLATLDRLAALFADRYAINRGRSAPAMGRYDGDHYYSGGAYYFSTLAAAEFCYRAGDKERGDAFLETVRAFTPADGALSEQFDQATGAQTSAKQLAWSHAAFITAAAARGS